MNEMPLSMLDVDPKTVRLEAVDVSQAELFFEDRIGAFFERFARARIRCTIAPAASTAPTGR